MFSVEWRALPDGALLEEYRRTDTHMAVCVKT
jgi:hypothetical protein